MGIDVFLRDRFVKEGRQTSFHAVIGFNQIEERSMMVESRPTSLFLNRNFFLTFNLALASFEELPGPVLIGISAWTDRGS